MYNLYFIEEIQKQMKTILARKVEYDKYKKIALSLKKEFDEKKKNVKQIKNKNKKQYEKLMHEIDGLKERILNIIKIGENEEKRFEKIKQYILRELRKNKEILEKYKDLEDEEIEEFKSRTKEFDTEKRKRLEENMADLEEKLKLNNLSPNEIKVMDEEERKNVNEIRGQYLNNKRKLEHYEKLKYVTLLGNELPENRISQYEQAIQYVQNEFSIENIEDVISKLEETLDIEKQKAQIKFDMESHKYTYIDERGKEHPLKDVFAEENGIYTSTLTPDDIEATTEYAKKEGLSKKQIDMIDFNLVECLLSYPHALDNYFESIKIGEPILDIEYNLEGNNKKFDRRTLKQIEKIAKRQETKGIASVTKNMTKLRNIINKSRAKVADFFALVGFTEVAGFIEGNASANTLSGINKNVEQEQEQWELENEVDEIGRREMKKIIDRPKRVLDDMEIPYVEGDLKFNDDSNTIQDVEIEEISEHIDDEER